MKKFWKMERYRDASIQKKLTLSTWLVAIMIIFAIDNYVTGTYKEKLDLRDFIRNRLTN